MPHILMVANVFLLLAAFYFIADPTLKLISKFGELPAAWGAFVGALVGLVGVAWTTNKGFQNIIKAQEHRAEVERAGREHQSNLARAAELEKEYRSSKVLAYSLMGEISALCQSIDGYQLTLRTKKLFVENYMYSLSGTELLKHQKPTWSTPLWDKLYGDIGALGPSIAGDLSSTFGFAKQPEVARELEFPDNKTFIDIVAAIDASHSVWRMDLLHVQSRLLSWVNGSEDPGPLTFAPHRRQVKPVEPDMKI